MPRSIDEGSTIEFTPSNSDNDSYYDNAPMDDAVMMKVPAEVAAEWIAKGVGVPASPTLLAQFQSKIGANKGVRVIEMGKRTFKTATEEHDDVVNVETCRGCWDGCDACCPELEEDAGYRLPTPAGPPADPRMNGSVCECGRCDACLDSHGIVDYRVRSLAPLAGNRSEMSFADLLQDPEEAGSHNPGRDEQDNVNAACLTNHPVNGVMNAHGNVNQGEAINPVSSLRKAFATLGLQNQESVSMEKLRVTVRDACLKASQYKVKYLQAYTTIGKHQSNTGSWADVPIEDKKTSGHANVKQVNDKNTVSKSGMPVQDEVDNLPDSNKKNYDEETEVKLPKWGAFGFDSIERAKKPWAADTEAATAPKMDGEPSFPSLPWRPAQSHQPASWSYEQTGYPPNKYKELYYSTLWGIGVQAVTGNEDRESDGGRGATTPVRSFGNVSRRPLSFHSDSASYNSTPAKSTVRQPSLTDLYSDSGCSDSTGASNEPLSITYCMTVQSGSKTLNIPISGTNVSGPEKEVVDGGMQKVWKWVADKGLGDKIDLQDAFDLAVNMYGEVEEETELSVIDTGGGPIRREYGYSRPEGWMG